jgi:hypothetical protein
MGKKEKVTEPNRTGKKKDIEKDMETCKGIKKSWPTRVSTAKGKKL